MNQIKDLKGADYDLLEQIWRDFWFNSHGFAAMRPAAQWALVFQEWLSRQGGEE